MSPRKKDPELSIVNFRASEKFREALKKRADEKEMNVTTYLKQLVLSDIASAK